MVEEVQGKLSKKCCDLFESSSSSEWYLTLKIETGSSESDK